jgi:branched-chain amino acid transport system substrate-binding protein
MMKFTLALAATALGVTAMAEPALAQANEQFLPSLVYRTGPYAPNGIPFADGVSDYWTLLNERDGGINGVKIASEECETGYATDKGVECYERLKSKGATGAGYFSPLSTGITFALTEKAPGDKIPLLTMGYGRSESRNGGVPVELHRCRLLLDRRRHRRPAHRPRARRNGQAQRQEDQPRLSRQPLRQGADRGAGGAR